MPNLKLIVAAITKKTNFIYILEDSIIKVKECYDLNLPCSEASEIILDYLSSFSLEENIIADFMELLNGLIAFYPYKDAFMVQLNRLLIITLSLKNDVSKLFSELITILYTSNNPEHQKIYQEILKLNRQKISTYEILLEIAKYFPLLQNSDEEKSTPDLPSRQ